MTYLMAKQDEGRHFVLVKDELLTVSEVTERHLPLRYFRLIDVGDSTVYWFFGARFTDSEDYTVIYENADEAIDDLLHKYRYTVEFFTPYAGNTNENWWETLTQDRDVPLDGEMYSLIRKQARHFSWLKKCECNVFITRKERGSNSTKLVSYFATDCHGFYHSESWIDHTLPREKGYGICFYDNVPEEV